MALDAEAFSPAFSACWRHSDGALRMQSGRANLSLHRGRAVLGDPYRTAYQPECTASAPLACLGQPRHPEIVDGREHHPVALVAAMLKAVAPPATMEACEASALIIAACQGSRERRALRQAAEMAQLPHPAIVSDIAAAVAAGLHHAPRQFQDQTVLVCHATSQSIHWGVAHCSPQETLVGRYGHLPRGVAEWEQSLLDRLGDDIESKCGEAPFGPLNQNMWRRQHLRIAQAAAQRLPTEDIFHWEALCGERVVRGHFNAADWWEISQPLQRQLAEQLAAAARQRQATRIWLLGACQDVPEWQLQIEQACELPAIAMEASTSALLAEGAALLCLPKEASVNLHDSAPYALGVQTFDRKQKRALNKIVVDANSRLRGLRSLKIGKATEPKLSVRLLQGNAAAAEDNVLLGECRIDVEPGDAVQLHLGYDSNGEARVLAQVNQGAPLETVIDDPAGLSASEAAEIQSWLQRIPCLLASTT